MPESIIPAALILSGFAAGLLVAVAVWHVAYWRGVHDQAQGKVKWPKNRRTGYDQGRNGTQAD